MWGKNLPDIFEKVQREIKQKIEETAENQSAFDTCCAAIKESLRQEITQDRGIKFLSEFFLIKPVVFAVFSKTVLAQDHITQTLETALEMLKPEQPTELDPFYKKVQQKIEDNKEPGAIQTLIKDIFQSFYKSIDKMGAKKKGVVYTPLPVVDFIHRLIDYVLKKDLNIKDGLKNPDFDVIDPFTGTGIFVTRLLDSDYCEDKEKTKHFYTNHLFANDVMLSAYYLGLMNIETTYMNKFGDYEPFPGMTCTDIFLNLPEGDPDRGRAQTSFDGFFYRQKKEAEKGEGGP